MICKNCGLKKDLEDDIDEQLDEFIDDIETSVKSCKKTLQVFQRDSQGYKDEITDFKQMLKSLEHDIWNYR